MSQVEIAIILLTITVMMLSVIVITLLALIATLLARQTEKAAKNLASFTAWFSPTTVFSAAVRAFRKK